MCFDIVMNLVGWQEMNHFTYTYVQTKSPSYEMGLYAFYRELIRYVWLANR